MEIIAIQENTIEEIVQRFADFTKKVKGLCQDDKTNAEWPDNQDMCNLLSISKCTLQSYRCKGTLPYFKIEYKCYYKQSDIDKLIKE